MFHFVVPAALENVDKACDVTFDIGIRIGDGVTYTGLGGEVNNDIKESVLSRGDPLAGQLEF